MTKPAELDVLDLAERVADGGSHLHEAETRARSMFDSDDDRGAAQAVLDLRDLTAAIGAVRAHASATRVAAAERASGQAVIADAHAVVPIHVRGHDVRGRRGRGRPTTLLVAASLVIGTTLIGVAIGAGGRSSPGPTPPDRAGEATAIAVVRVSDRPAPVPAVTFTELGAPAITATSERVGWAMTTSTVFRTIDGGVSWTDVRPPVPVTPGGTVVVDDDTAVVASGGPSIRIATTNDGGAAWQSAALDDTSVTEAPVLTFPSADTGFATFLTTEAGTVHVYRTSDGGSTWSGPVVARTPSGMDDWVAAPDLDRRALWLSNGERDGQPFDDRLLLSVDGGATWQERTFPVDSTSPAGVLKWVDAAWSDGAARWVIVVTNDGDRQSIYTSNDDGRSWDLVRTWPHAYTVRLVSATEWIGVASDLAAIEMWSTRDGGGSWRTEVGPSQVFLDSVSLASPDHAWGVHQCDRVAGPWFPGPDPLCDGRVVKRVLLSTSDAGRTWTEVGR